MAAAWWSVTLFVPSARISLLSPPPPPLSQIKPERDATHSSSFLRIATGESPGPVDAAVQFIEIGVAVVAVLAGSFADFVAGALLGQDLLLHDDVAQSAHGFQHAVLPADQVFAFGERWQGAGDGAASLRLVGGGAEVAGEVQGSSGSFGDLWGGVSLVMIRHGLRGVPYLVQGRFEFEVVEMAFHGLAVMLPTRRASLGDCLPAFFDLIDVEAIHPPCRRLNILLGVRENIGRHGRI